jgi:hypothetical protein
MTKISIVLFSAFLLVVSVLANNLPDSPLEYLITSDTLYTSLRIALAAVLISTLMTRSLPASVRILLGLTGAFMISAGIAGFGWSTYAGLFELKLMPLDFFVFLEGGVLALVIGLDRKSADPAMHALEDTEDDDGTVMLPGYRTAGL